VGTRAAFTGQPLVVSSIWRAGSWQPGRDRPHRRSVRSERLAVPQRDREPIQSESGAGFAGSIFRVPLVTGLEPAAARAALEGHGLDIYAAAPSGAKNLDQAGLTRACAFVDRQRGPRRERGMERGAAGLRIPTRASNLSTPPRPPLSCCTRHGARGPAYEPLRQYAAGVRGSRRGGQGPPARRTHGPDRFEDFAGQEHILGPGKPLLAQIERGELGSIILWGRPASAKTTLARLIARVTRSDFVPSARLSGIKEVKASWPRPSATAAGRSTLLSSRDPPLQPRPQQDRLLYVERGDIHAHRRHHRESVLRNHLGSAVALQGVTRLRG